MIRCAIVAACVVLVGCSGNARPTTSTVVAVATTVPTIESTSVELSEQGSDPLQDPTLISVEFEVHVESSGLDDVVAVGIDPTLAEEVDPFTEFASCSGLRASVGTYVVSAAAKVGTIAAVSVLSSDHAGTPGIHEAEIRVEPRVGTPVNAIGTMTLAAGLRFGTFLAFEPDGKEVSGSFRCTGGDESAPEPLVTGADDDVLDAIEVVALLRRGASERVVSLAVASDSASGATLRCPAVTGVSGAVGTPIVRVDGDERIGSITTFELSDGPPMRMRLHVGAAVFDFTEVDATIDPSGASGVFSASTDDGTTIDGAFRCT